MPFQQDVVRELWMPAKMAAYKTCSRRTPACHALSVNMKPSNTRAHDVSISPIRTARLAGDNSFILLVIFPPHHVIPGQSEPLIISDGPGYLFCPYVV